MSSPINKKHKRDQDNKTDTQTETETETETETSEQKDILLGGVELGGTTIRAVIARNTPTNVIFTKTIPTTTPHETLQQARQVFESQPVAAIGIGSFGPIDLDPTSKTYGYITSTPKLAWQNADVLSTFKSLGVPCGFTTDVNAAAMGEIAWGSHGNVRSCAYVTVGTGVGAGIVVRGEPITGLLHPEAGHMRVPRHPDDKFAGSCPFHGDCLEGMASAGACAARFNLKPADLPNLSDDHQLWEFVSWYLAQMCATLVLVISPEVIVLGGGVLQHKGLFEMIHEKTKQLLNGYIQVPKITQSISAYIVPSRFDAAGSKTSAGQVGVLELSRVTYEKHQQQATSSTSTTPSQPSSKL